MLKRLLVFLIALLPALAAGAPMGFDEARHLLNRTSFAANVEDIDDLISLSIDDGDVARYPVVDP